MMQITVENVKEAYTWSVLCTDGVVLCEYDRLEGRGFAEVAELSLSGILLLPLAGVGPSHRVDVPAGATPIFFRRRSVEINPLQGECMPRPTVHCVGWKRNDEAVYLFCFDDGSTLLSNDLQAV